MRSWIAALIALGLAVPSCTAPQTHTIDDGGTDAPAPAIDAALTPDGGNDAAMIDDAAVAPDVGTDAGPPMVTISGTVVGLTTGLGLNLTNGIDTRAVAGASGNVPFSFSVARGASYDIELGTTPSTLLCVVYRGNGTASADVTNVFVGCSTSVDLYSWFPFDGNAHAARGADWTSTAGTLAFATDRIGRTAYALDASDASVAYQLSHELDGRTAVVAPQSTQFTVSMWARLPTSVTTTTTQNLFAHLGTGSQSAAAQVVWSATGAPSFQFYFYWDGGFAMSTTTATSTLARDEWHHLTIAAIGPAGTAGAPQFARAIYVDGVRQATTSTCCGWSNDTHYWYLGQSNVQRDDLRYYTRMLSDAEIAGIYAAEHVP